MPALMRELSLQKKPHWLLVMLMNALEKKRQSQGLGWSRAWNKYGLTVFRTHIQPREEAVAHSAAIARLLGHFLADAPILYREFARSLLADPTRMTFTFHHNNTTDGGTQYEGFTLSLGRTVPTDKTKRDRLDIIVEDERRDGRVDGVVDRIRIYACPWETYGQDRSFHLVERVDVIADDLDLAQNLFRFGVERYHHDKADESRQWNHWSVRYIDYFGPRDFIPEGSSFT